MHKSLFPQKAGILLKLSLLKESLWLKCLWLFSAGVWLCRVPSLESWVFTPVASQRISSGDSTVSSWEWSAFIFTGLSCLMLEPTLEFTDLGKLPSKNCSSWVQPPGKGQYKTLAPTAYSDTCWQCQWFSVSDGHEVDCRNHSPVSFFYKCLLLSASPESPVLAGWLSSHQPEVWPC